MIGHFVFEGALWLADLYRVHIWRVGGQECQLDSLLFDEFPYPLGAVGSESIEHHDLPWRIQLIVPPWVPAEKVLRAYRRLRGQVPKGRELPKTTTPLEVARFVWKQERLHGYREPTPWFTFFQQWKNENPKTDIKDYRNFRTIFFRGNAAVKELNYNWPQPRNKSLPDK